MVVKAIESYDDFTTIINSDKPVVIDFWAPWCGPCRAISPIFEKLSEPSEFPNVEFYKVNIDEHEQIAQEVGIRSIPAFIQFKGGNKVSEFVGAHPKNLTDLVSKANGA